MSHVPQAGALTVVPESSPRIRRRTQDENEEEEEEEAIPQAGPITIPEPRAEKETRDTEDREELEEGEEPLDSLEKSLAASVKNIVGQVTGLLAEYQNRIAEYEKIKAKLKALEEEAAVLSRQNRQLEESIQTLRAELEKAFNDNSVKDELFKTQAKNFQASLSRAEEELAKRKHVEKKLNDRIRSAKRMMALTRDEMNNLGVKIVNELGIGKRKGKDEAEDETEDDDRKRLRIESRIESSSGILGWHHAPGPQSKMPHGQCVTIETLKRFQKERNRIRKRAHLSASEIPSIQIPACQVAIVPGGWSAAAQKKSPDYRGEDPLLLDFVSRMPQQYKYIELKA